MSNSDNNKNTSAAITVANANSILELRPAQCKTFAAVELLEQILLHVPATDLLVKTQLVSHHFCTIITTSQILQEKLCFRQPIPRVPQTTITAPKDNANKDQAPKLSLDSPYNFHRKETINPFFASDNTLLYSAIWYARKTGPPSLTLVDGEYINHATLDARNVVLTRIETDVEGLRMFFWPYDPEI